MRSASPRPWHARRPIAGRHDLLDHPDRDWVARRRPAVLEHGHLLQGGARGDPLRGRPGAVVGVADALAAPGAEYVGRRRHSYLQVELQYLAASHGPQALFAWGPRHLRRRALFRHDDQRRTPQFGLSTARPTVGAEGRADTQALLRPPPSQLIPARRPRLTYSSLSRVGRGASPTRRHRPTRGRCLGAGGAVRL